MAELRCRAGDEPGSRQVSADLKPQLLAEGDNS